jgi:hypothetical protein
MAIKLPLMKDLLEMLTGGADEPTVSRVEARESIGDLDPPE